MTFQQDTKPNQNLSAWQPILSGALRAQAEEALAAIAAHIPERTPDSAETDSDALAATVSSGTAGQALFYGYLGKALCSDKYADFALGLMEQSIDALAAANMHPALYGGFTGIAWTVEHLQKNIYDSDDDLNEDIDEQLIRFLSKADWQGEYDLINGLTGYGVYGLERIRYESGKELLALVVEHLSRLAQENSPGVTWLSRPELLTPQKAERFPDGIYDLCLAHGMAGAVALLAKAIAAQPDLAGKRYLINGALAWIRAQRIEGAQGLSFPGVAWPGLAPRVSRLAWCYGDLSIAAALFVAARSVNEPDWEREAVDIAVKAARCSDEQSGVKDGGICHGAAGIGHILNRMYQATGDVRLKELALLWLQRLLDMRRPGQGVGGFSAWVFTPDGRADWQDDAGFLTGSAGIGLVLLAAISDLPPCWDRLLLISAN